MASYNHDNFFYNGTHAQPWAYDSSPPQVLKKPTPSTPSKATPKHEPYHGLYQNLLQAAAAAFTPPNLMPWAPASSPLLSVPSGSPYLDTASSICGSDNLFGSFPSTPQDIPLNFDISSSLYGGFNIGATHELFPTNFIQSPAQASESLLHDIDRLNMEFDLSPGILPPGTASPSAPGGWDVDSSLTADLFQPFVASVHPPALNLCQGQKMNGEQHTAVYDPLAESVLPMAPLATGTFGLGGAPIQTSPIQQPQQCIQQSPQQFIQQSNIQQATADISPNLVAKLRQKSQDKKTGPKRLGNAKGMRRVQPEAKPVEKQPTKPRRNSAQGLECHTCCVEFSTKLEVREHIDTHHARVYACVFNWAGCTSTFSSKNEWKRHAATQHLALTYWVCTEGACASITNDDPLPAGGIFNRKDLYTQHLRRMHVPEEFRQAVNAKEPPVAWNHMLTALQAKAERKRGDLPKFMTCPQSGCSGQFAGVSCWDDWMEHVAHHLEGAANGTEPLITFGVKHDDTLALWAECVGVVKRVVHAHGPTTWKMCGPLKFKTGAGRSGKLGKCAAAVTDGDCDVLHVIGCGQ